MDAFDEFLSDSSRWMESNPEAVTADDVTNARLWLVQAATEFDAIEDGEPEADWREAFGRLREAAKALGCSRAFDELGIG